MNRREFLKDAARMIVALPFGVFLIDCADDGGATPDENDPTPPDSRPHAEGSNVFFTSSKTSEHSHSFTVPLDAFSTPPFGGVAGNTTRAQEHSHKLEVPQEAFRRAAGGEIVKVQTSKELDHVHIFSIVKIG
ncbi:MAG TPA: hypothetical protein VM580_21785 [Labilithrix sp.]|nr:hypothetical protein [Labilithrix sp.]